MSKHLNITPLVFRGKNGEFLHSPCALFKSSIRQETDADYWDIEGNNEELVRAYHKLVIHYSNIEEHDYLDCKNPKWKWEWILSNSKEIGFINLSLAYDESIQGFQPFDIIDDWNERVPLPDLRKIALGSHQVFRCTPPGSDIPEGLFSDEELNYPNKAAVSKPFRPEDEHYVGWTVDEDWIVDEEDDDTAESRKANHEEINNLKEQIIQLQESNNEIKSILQHHLRLSNVNNNITYNIQDNAITGSIDIDENSD